MPVLNPKELIDHRVQAYKDIHDRTRATRATIGVSGGADSALVVQLLAKAVGPDRVTALWQGASSNSAALERARDVCAVAGVRLIQCDWTVIIAQAVSEMQTALTLAGYSRAEIEAVIESDPDSIGGFRSCFRAPPLRLANRLTGNGLVHGTGNEDEDRFMRFFQKGGDSEVDTSGISMFSKGEVYQLLFALPTPRSILNAIPSPDLLGKGDGHSDDTEMKRFLRMPRLDWSVYSFLDKMGQYRNVGLIERINRFLDERIEIIGDLSHPDGYNGPTVMAVEDVLFGVSEPDLDALVALADVTGQFRGMDGNTLRELLGNVRRVEAATRHKYNPMLETLGTREDMVREELLTDDLPDMPLAAPAVVIPAAGGFVG